MASLITLLVVVVAGLAVLDRNVLLGQLAPSRPNSPQVGDASLVAMGLYGSGILVPDGLSKVPVRCSISGLIRIEFKDRFLLVCGNRIPHQFQSVRGVYKRYPPSLPVLRHLRVEDDDKIPIDSDSQGDLQVRVPGGNIREFLEWLQSRTGRETDPWREFDEELISNGVVNQAAFPYISCSFEKTLISPHFSPNQVHWGADSERIVLRPRFFSNP